MIARRSSGNRRQKDLRVWLTRVRISEEANARAWKDALRNHLFYAGNQALPDEYQDISDWSWDTIRSIVDNQDYIVVNRILAILASQNASILWRNPWHSVISRRFMGMQAEAARETAEMALNFFLQEPTNKWLQNARLATLQAEMAVGVMKTTHTPSEGNEPDEKDEETGELMVQVDPETGQESFGYVGGIPKLDEKGRPIFKKGNRYVVDNRIPGEIWRSEWVNYFDMRFDPEGGNDFERHSWIGQRFSMPWLKFKKNELFRGIANEVKTAAYFIDERGLSSRTRQLIRKPPPSRGTFEGFDPTETDEDLMRVWGFQLWDMEHNEVNYIIDGYHKLAAKVEYPRFVQKNPYSICKLHEFPGEFNPITEISQIRGLSEAYNMITTMHLRHAKRYTRAYLAREGMLDSANQSRLKDEEDGRVVFYRKTYSRQDFDPIKDAPLDPQIYALRQALMNDMTEITGRSPESRAIAESETATQAALVEGATRTRDNDKRSILREFFQNHAKKFLDMLQATLDDPMLIQIVGPQGVPFSKATSKAQIQGDLGTYIEMDELEPHDNRADRADMNEILAVMGPIAFAAPTFSKRFWAVRRRFDPQMAKELELIGRQMLQAELTSQQRPQGGVEQGGPKTTSTGPDEGRSFEGRTIGRKFRRLAQGRNGGGEK